MHHPNSVLETHSKDHGFKVRSCSTEERKKIAQRNLSIMHKSEEMRSHFSTQNFFLKSIDVVVNLILILLFAVKEVILLIFDSLDVFISVFLFLILILLIFSLLILFESLILLIFYSFDLF